MTRRLWAGPRAEWGGVAISALAALALALTVYVATIGWDEAEEPLERGEGAALVAQIHDDLDESVSAESRDLARELERRSANGLKFVAIVHPGVGVVAHAGQETIAGASEREGAFLRKNGRARLALAMAPPTHRRVPPPRFAPPPRGEPGDEEGRPPPGPLGGPPLLVIEFEPRVTAQASKNVARTQAVAGVAAIVLILAAALLSRAIRRASATEKKATRDQKLIALGQMSAVMAHELRNPLASLKGHAQLLEEMLERDSKEAKKAERVVHEAERLERLTNDLLDFVREKPMSRESVAIAEFAREVTERVAGARGSFAADGVTSLVLVDRARLSIALGNVVRNALQATEGEEEVLVRVKREGDRVVIDVTDRGAGVPAGDEEKIFEPFMTTRVHGTGLGLAVARDIVERHGGTLRVARSDANDGENKSGATFTLTLPIAGAKDE